MWKRTCLAFPLWDSLLNISLISDWQTWILTEFCQIRLLETQLAPYQFYISGRYFVYVKYVEEKKIEYLLSVLRNLQTVDKSLE